MQSFLAKLHTPVSLTHHHSQGLQASTTSKGITYEAYTAGLPLGHEPCLLVKLMKPVAFADGARTEDAGYEDKRCGQVGRGLPGRPAPAL